MLFGLAAILLLVGLLLLTLGIRGRRIGDTPHCRRCKFDLVGLPLPAEIEHDDPPTVTRCPECGSRLTAPRAITTGYRVRRPILGTLGVLALLLAVVLGGFALSASRTTFNDVKPLWLLTLEATYLGTDTREAVGAELLIRHQRTPLTNDQLTALINPALDAQADTMITWEQSPWWQLLDAAFTASLLSTKQQSRYLRTAIGDMLWEPPETALADHDWLPIGSTQFPRPAAPPRLVPAGAIHIALRLQTFAVDGIEQQLHTHERDFNWRAYCRQYEIKPDQFGEIRRAHTGGKIAGDVRSPTPVNLFPTLNLSEGKYTLTASWHIEATLYTLPNNGNLWRRDLSNDPDTSWESQAEHTLTSAPLDEILQFVQSNSKDHPQPNIEIGWSVRLDEKPTPPNEVHVMPSSAHGARVMPFRISGMMGRDDPRPIPEWVVGFLILRANDQSWPLAQRPFKPGDPLFEPARFARGPGEGNTYIGGLRAYFDGLPQELARVDLVIMPDPVHAAQIGASGPFWNEPIIIRDIPLNWNAIRDREPPAVSD